MSDIKYFLDHPPRCLTGFQARQPEKLPDVEFDGHGEEWNPVFVLACSCGAKDFRLSGFATTEEDFSLFLSPLEATCTNCNRAIALLDTDVHGYDAELGHGSCTRRAEGTPGHFSCPNCTSHRGSLFMRFEFPRDLFDDDFDDVQIAKEDLFTWVTCVSQCSGCGQSNVVSDFECA